MKHKKNFKYIIFLFLILILIIFYGVYINIKENSKDNENNVIQESSDYLYLSSTEIFLKINDSYDFYNNISTNIDKHLLSFTSSDTNVVSINSGIITAINVGKATISVSYNNLNVKCSVEVVNENIYVTDITFNSEKININVSDRVKLNYSYLPNEATVREFVFTSSNSDIVTVDDSGYVVGLKEGISKITISSKYNMNISSSIEVQVFDIGDYLMKKSRRMNQVLIQRMNRFHNLLNNQMKNQMKNQLSQVMKKILRVNYL